MASMKKNFFIISALSLLSMVSCQRDINVQNSSEVVINGRVISIEAQAPSQPMSKTEYDSEGRFNWLSTDQIVVIAQADGNAENQKAFTFSTDAEKVLDNGKTATFTGTIEDGYVATEYAAYPISLASDNTNSGYGGAFVKVPSSVSGKVSSTMLIGINDGNGGYTFNTAMSVFKIVVNNLPSTATELRLVSNDRAQYPLDGDFTLETVDGAVTLDFAHYHSEWSHYDKGYLSVNLASHGTSDNEFYFNVPIGTYAANTLSIQVFDADGNNIDTKTISKSLTTVRNELLVLPTLTVDRWETLGEATFYDQFYIDSYKLKSWNHATTTLQRNIQNPSKYRLVNPYLAYSVANSYSQPTASDDYLYFSVDKSTGLVTFENCFTGIRFGGYDYTVCYNKWDGKANTSPDHTKVIAFSDDGEPTCVQLAPYYAFKDLSNGYSRNSIDGLIMIIFPDYDDSFEPMSSSLATVLTPEVGVSGNNVVSFSATLGASAADAISALSSATAVNISENITIEVPNDAIATYYVAIKANFNSGESKTSTYPFYTLSASAATAYAKQFKSSFILNANSGSVGSSTITFAVSNNPFKGNIMITEFDGMCYDVSEINHTTENSTGIFVGQDFSVYKDGAPVYGYYNGTMSYPNVTFYNVMDQVFYTDANGASHYIVGDSLNGSTAPGGTNTNIQFAFGSTTAYYRSTVYTVVCWPRWIGNYWKLGNNAGYNFELYQFGAN